MTEQLFKRADREYADFQAKLTPGIPRECFIGVRIPVLRAFAKELYREGRHQAFLQTLPHRYFDENMLHCLLLSLQKDFDRCIAGVERFLPYVDNWAVCDIMAPKVFRDHKEALLPYIRKWITSSHVYTCRFAMEMLMSHFLDGDFKPEYPKLVAGVTGEEYYVNMMIAWYFATALAKQWDSAFPYLEKRLLSPWVHNKTIQKSLESYRITPEQKNILRAMKIR